MVVCVVLQFYFYNLFLIHSVRAYLIHFGYYETLREMKVDGVVVQKKGVGGRGC